VVGGLGVGGEKLGAWKSSKTSSSGEHAHISEREIGKGSGGVGRKDS